MDRSQTKTGCQGQTPDKEDVARPYQATTERTVIKVGGRQKKYLRVAYDEGVLPVLPPRHPLARLYLEEAHKTDHAGFDAMIMRSWSHVWITRVRQKAKAVKRACFTCQR
jgi:hypothetical protein